MRSPSPVRADRRTRSLPVFLGVSLALGLMTALFAVLPAPEAEASRAKQAARESALSKSYGVKAEKASNRQRVRAGRVRTKSNACLAKWAGRHAARLARAGGGIYHQNLEPILRDCGLSLVGENVAAGYGSGTSTVTQGWMKSPGHRRNLLDGRFRSGEVVARRSADGRWYAVQLLGRR